MVSDTRAKTWRLENAKQTILGDASKFRALNSDVSAGHAVLDKNCMVSGTRARTLRLDSQNKKF